MSKFQDFVRCGLGSAPIAFSICSVLVAGDLGRLDPQATQNAVKGAGKALTIQNLEKVPLSFERSGADFVARGPGYAVNISGASVSINAPKANHIRMEFVHGRKVAGAPGKELPGKVNYILGNDPRRWRLGIPTYDRIIYSNLYPGIDVIYYGHQNQLEFDLTVAPGADLRAVRLRFIGGGKTQVDSGGNLTVGGLQLKMPNVLQGNATILARYKLLKNGEVGFDSGSYDRRKPLIIDPTLVYSTRFGGGTNSNQGNAIALDGTGSAYVAGYTAASDFPTANPAFAGAAGTSQMGFISKFDPTGTSVVFSTYIGGSSFNDLYGIAVDTTGAAWVAGYTTSPDFPLLSPYQSSLGGVQDAVVLKLSPAGTLVYSTFLGGVYGTATSIAVDPQGNAYVTGQGGPGFPTTLGVYQPLTQTDAAFVAKFSKTGSLLWSTLAGGMYGSYGGGIAVDQFGNSYITGSTTSPTFPNAPPGGAQTINHGNGDAFVAKLNFNGSALLYFTFLGGSQYEIANSISVDPVSGVAVIAGNTSSTDLPITAGAVQPASGGGPDGFVAKLNAAGSGFMYMTYLGGHRKDYINAVTTDSNGNAYVAGYTSSDQFPTTQAIQSKIESNPTSLFVTSDRGATWIPFDTNLPGLAYSASPDPAIPGGFVATTELGIYRTTNGGLTWTQRLSTGGINIARSPANSATIYGVNGAAIYQSVDDGVTWNLKGSLPNCCAGDIFADSTSSGTAYVRNDFRNLMPAILKTTDNGVTWTPAVAGLPSVATAAGFATGSDGSLYVGLDYSAGGSPGGAYKSIDHGNTWIPLTNGLHPNFGVPAHGLAVAPTNPSIVYVSDFFTLYGSANGGATWTNLGSPPGGTAALEISSTSATTLFYAEAAYPSPSPISVSADAGLTWTQGTGLGVASVTRLYADPANGNVVYAVANVVLLPFITKIDAAGQNLLYSTYLGDYGDAYGIATNGTGDVFVTGSTWEFPTTPSALQRNRNYNQNNLDGFVTRISDATAACSYSVDPAQSLEIWYPHIVQYVIAAPSGCSWTASSDQPWATVTSGASGTGSGIVYVTVSNDPTQGTRTANLNIAGQTVPLHQRWGNCGYNQFSPDTGVVPGGGGSFTTSLVVAAGCDWTITNNYPTAVTVTAGASGTGTGSVSIAVAPNPSTNTRTFVIGSPQGGSVTITQAGTTAPAVVATIISSPSGASITTTGSGCIPGTYTTPANLTWSANSNCSVYFLTPETIAGAPEMFNSATVNGGNASTTNPLTVNSGSSALAINGNFLAPCSYSFSQPGQDFGAQGGLGSFTVTAAAACSWHALSSTSWITILPSGSGGTAKVNYAVPANTGGIRSGTISVGGQQFQIAQANQSCTYTIGPANGTINSSGGDARVVVNTPAGCPWTAVSHTSWLSVTAGTSGSGNGAVTVHAAANAGGSRAGSVTIAGLTYSVTESAPGTSACGAIDVTGTVSVSLGGFAPIPPAGSNLLIQNVTVTNGTGSPINGPVNLVLVGLPNAAGVGLANGEAQTTCFSSKGDQYVTFSNGMAAGARTTFTLTFVDSTPNRPQYSTKVLSGKPSH